MEIPVCKKIRDSKRTFWLNVRKHGLLKVKPSDCVGSPYLDYCLDLCPYGMDDLDDPCKLLLTPMMNKERIPVYLI